MAEHRLFSLLVFCLVLGSWNNGVLSDTTHLLRPLDRVTHGLRGLGAGIRHETRGQDQEPNPYIFEGHTFTKVVESEAGEIRVLPNFTEATAQGTLKSLEGYQISFVILEPSSAFLPHYLDADLILDVFHGRGRISWLQGNGNDYELQERVLGYGDFLGLAAGTVFYFTNIDAAERLCLYSLLYTGPSPSHNHPPKPYFVAGGQNPSTVYSGFGWSTLQAAFNRNKEQLERVLGQQTKGPIVYLKKEQIQKLNSDYSARRWKRGWVTSTEDDEELEPFSIMKRKYDFSSDNGWLIEAGGPDYPVFRKHGIAVSLWFLAAGSMVAPHWNSEAVKVGFVLQGEGTLEISCPRKGDHGISYDNVQGRVKKGDVFVVPAGFANTQISAPDGIFEFVFYEVNAAHNRRHYLAGSNSVVRHLSKEILEVSYGAAWEDIGPLLDAQKDQIILRAPQLDEDE